MPTVLIYQDYVYNNGCVQRALVKRFGRAEVADVDAEDILAGALTPEVKLFVMPGGASRYAMAKLNGEGNRQIRNYVEQGGRYFGICAGAYYGCRRIEWKPSKTPSIHIKNELGFFPGSATGPLAPFWSVIEGEDYLAKRVELKTNTGKSFPAFYWGGPTFRADEGESNFEVLARYNEIEDAPPAVVTGSCGMGRYLLVSPHLEIDTRQLELMRFDVFNNRHADVRAMSDEEIQGISLDYFNQLLSEFLT